LEIEDFADGIINDKEPYIDIDESIGYMEIMDDFLKLRLD